MISADTNLFIYAADPDSPNHVKAREFFSALDQRDEEFVLCELVLVELYILLRNPGVFKAPYSAEEATNYCTSLKKAPNWRCIDYSPEVSAKLWQWAKKTNSGYRDIIDARLALTLRHHGVSHFATANSKHFQGFGFAEVWNPIAG